VSPRVALLDRDGCGSTADSAPDVGGDVARAELTTLGPNLTTWYQQHGTYAGASTGLPAFTVERADTISYCLEDATSHLAGPAGPVAPACC